MDKFKIKLSSQESTPPSPVTVEPPSRLERSSSKEVKSRHIKLSKFIKYLFVVLAALTMIMSFSVLVITTVAISITDNFSHEQPARFGGLVVVCTSSLAVFCTLIYAFPAIFDEKSVRKLQIITILLILLPVLQIVIAITCLAAREGIQMVIKKELVDSFRQALKNDEKNVERWAKWQSSLTCCGLNGPEDYRDLNTPYLPLKVPSSCCPVEASKRTPFEQKIEYQLCQSMKAYYKEGCWQYADEMFNLSMLILYTTIGYVILELITASVSIFFLNIRQKILKSAERNDEEAY